MNTRNFLILLAPILYCGCSAQVPQSQSDLNTIQDDMIYCESPRPEVCALNYLPVCAERDTGIRCVKAPCPATEHKTYSNACGACADPKVVGYIAHSCPSTAGE
jgi:hypothetical protein